MISTLLDDREHLLRLVAAGGIYQFLGFQGVQLHQESAFFRYMLTQLLFAGPFPFPPLLDRLASFNVLEGRIRQLVVINTYGVELRALLPDRDITILDLLVLLEHAAPLLAQGLLPV